MPEQTSVFKIKVTFDENRIPVSIYWEAGDIKEQSACKAFMLSFWDKAENNTLRMDLWTNDMYVEEMKMFYHQSILSMADAYERSTGDEEIAEEIRNFGISLGERMKLIKRKS